LSATLAEWADAISDLSDEQVEHGIRAARDEYPDWPPTIGQFRALCRQGSNDALDWEQQSAGRDPFPRMPEIKSTPEGEAIARAAFAQLQEIMSKARSDE
jgi:hypothetical protein